ncbi:hypothetical protein MPTK1_5g18890 [Marchantia polymorpha subsp. ruderalis]|uniref:Uncharacterized protein n=2 Tax=Marchantia polymorpha TaxID=3197 RepID=A0AAF6BJW3_MARPO|nr:hypothetical protein MARPO_0073s0053 [Marchantia polymorpha]BBN12297.1 hypothetical protein Mp_5g18890 [Marchantia polymorpha subsp. ruderalis]|eukprot:PTQ35179.1 hypothetical protein MARPO_0073s0053 [Marchantia polymorpha]
MTLHFDVCCEEEEAAAAASIQVYKESIDGRHELFLICTGDGSRGDPREDDIMIPTIDQRMNMIPKL